MKDIKFLKILLSLCGSFCLICCNPAKAFHPDAINYNNIGIKYTKNKEYDKAIEYFKKAIQADSSLNNAYYNIGSVYKHTGNSPLAIKSFQLLLRNSPDDDEVAYLLADLHYEKQDYDKALLYLSSIEKTSPIYKDSIELFKKVNNKINESVEKEPVKPVSSIAKPVVKPANPAPKAAAPATEQKQNSNKPSANTSKFTYTDFSGPTGIAEDENGNVYVADYNESSINIFSADGKIKRTIKSEEIKGPVGIAADKNCNIYVANYTAGNIIKIDKNQNIKILYTDIIKPYYLYMNKAGALYVSEQDKNTVIRLGIPE